MTWYETLVTYVVTWWLVIFMVLPWGAHPEENPLPGNEPGAPARPHMLIKLAVTTVIAALITWGIAAAIQANLIDFRAVS